MEKLIHRIIHNKCYLCKKSGAPICLDCFFSLKKSLHWSGKSKYPLISFFKYEGLAREILHLSKYPPFYAYLLKYLCQLTFVYRYDTLKSTLLKDRVLADRTVCVPVPISFSKLFDRGYNQADIIADELGEQLSLSSISVLNRTRQTKALANLTFEERISEVDRSVKVNLKHYLLRGLNLSRIILVDDVFTSGSTLNECATRLYQKGYRDITYLTLFTI